MHSHAEIRYSPHEPAELYALVVDIERYPEFLPWCRAARITERRDEYFIGELIISFSGFTERYSSRVTPHLRHPRTGSEDPARVDSRDRHENDRGYAIEVSLVNGPFTTLANHWKFEPAPQGGTNIHFAVEFEFKSKLLDKLMGNFFARAVDKMGDAFVKRADALYA